MRTLLFIVSLKRKIGKRGPKAKYPMATVCHYGPDDQRASKVAVGIIPSPGAEPIVH